MKPVRVYFLCSLLAHIRAETVKVGVRVARLWHDSCTKLGGEWVYLSGYQGENISPKFKPFCMWHEWFFSNYSWCAQEGFFFPNLHFQLVYRNLIANELCKLGCTYMVRTILFLTQFKWSSLLTCRDNECCSTGCHIRFGGEWVCLSGYQVRTFPLNSSLSVCDMNVVLFKLQLVCTGRFFFPNPS